MSPVRLRLAAAIVVSLSVAACSAHSEGARALKAIATADPVIVRGFSAGSSSRGPHCRAPFASEAYDRECGLVYAIDTLGHFRQICEYRDPRSPFIAARLVRGPGVWLYGTSSVVGVATGGPRPVLFRRATRASKSCTGSNPQNAC